MDSLGGPGSYSAAPFVNGIINFSSQYAILNNSYSSYFSTLSKLNQSNIGTSITSLSSAVSTIVGTSAAMPQNPIFPLPSSYNLGSLYSTCTSYSSTNQPWYCVDIGFCQLLNFNITLMYGIQSTIAQLQASPLSSTGLSSATANSLLVSKSYVGAVISSKENASFRAFLNASEPQYNSIVQKSQALLGMFSNSSLSAALLALESTFNTVLTSGASQNITASNTLFANALSKANAAYAAAYSVFSPVYDLAQSNNYLIAVDQLSYVRMPASLARLALEQQEINARIDSGLNQSQLPAELQQMTSVSAGLSLLKPVTLGSMVKAFDGAIIGALLTGTAPISAKNSSAAMYAAAVSLVIGAVIVLLFYVLVYSRMKRNRKIRLHPRAKKAWRALFIVLGILVIVYAVATYSDASSANTLLPLSGFINAVASGKSVAIVLNNTDASMQACSGAVQSSLIGMNKTVYVISIRNGTCTSTNQSFSGACLGEVAGSMPVVLMSSGASGIAYKGLYGHVLYASGAAASGASCPLDAIFSK